MPIACFHNAGYVGGYGFAAAARRNFCASPLRSFRPASTQFRDQSQPLPRYSSERARKMAAEKPQCLLFPLDQSGS